MKRILSIVLFLAITQYSFATEWLTYYVYFQKEYIQGTWSRTTLLDKSGSYIYLHPQEFEGLFGSEDQDFAITIYAHLAKQNPKRYNFTRSLTVEADTVIITTKDSISDFDAVKNELTASFVLNNFAAVKIIQRNKAQLFFLKDISVPYMDLVMPATDSLSKIQIADSIIADTATSIPTTIPNQTANSTYSNKPSGWLILSIAINLLLIILLMRRMSR